MNYTIELAPPLTHLLKISVEINTSPNSELELKLPIWRPGRYEAANYAKNIKSISFKDTKNRKLTYEKKNASAWLVKSTSEKIIATYEYYAHHLDAGNSWYDENQVYINFINCLLYTEEHLNEKCHLHCVFPTNYKIACGLNEFESFSLEAVNYHHLVDSPLIASPDMERFTFTSNGIPFSIWFQGAHNLVKEKVIEDFKKFTDYQIKTMEQFPEGDYHFLNQITNYKHYHGVEHGNSTVICIGPGNILNSESLYSEFLGVSSHELFHAWNILKIRPKELMPYDFSQPPVFPSGYVAEGFTTYYGDLFLVRSGVFDGSWYLNELNKLFTRHFHNYGRLNNSVIDSSIDLWIDGYQPSAPHKKSSIYVEGAMIALTLDLLIRGNTNNAKSLDDVMRLLWVKHGKVQAGYSKEDVQEVCEQINGGELKEYFHDFVYGTADKTVLVNELLNAVGCQLSITANDSFLEGTVGIKIAFINGSYIVHSIAPNSVGESFFSMKDKIIAINGMTVNDEVLKSLQGSILEVEIERNSEPQVINLDVSHSQYFNKYAIEKVKNPSDRQKDSFKNWLNVMF